MDAHNNNKEESDLSESSRACSIRLPPVLLDEIDELVATRRFKSRSSFFEQCALRYLEDLDPHRFEQRLIAAFDSPTVEDALHRKVLAGLEDPALLKVYREMNKAIVKDAFGELLFRRNRHDDD